MRIFYATKIISHSPSSVPCATYFYSSWAQGKLVFCNIGAGVHLTRLEKAGKIESRKPDLHVTKF